MQEEYGLAGKQQRFNVNHRLIFIIYFILSIIVALHMTAQYMGVYFKTEPISLFGVSFYPFWKVPQWYLTAKQYPFCDKAVDIFYWWFILPNLFVFSMIFYFIHKTKGNKKLHGSAKWATKKEIEEMGYIGNKDGVYIGGYKNGNALQYLKHNGPEHILCFAPTRSGKGVGLILPSLYAWQGSSIVLDIKGENWALTAGYRKSLGHKVIKFDPTDITDVTATFNPLEEIDLTDYGCIKQVQNIALMLVDPDGKGLTDYWNKAGYAFLAGVLLHCLVCIKTSSPDERTATLQDLVLMLSGQCPLTGTPKSLDELFKEMRKMDHTLFLDDVFADFNKEVGKEIHRFISSSATEMENKGDQEVKGVVSSALVNLSLFRDPVITKNTAKSDFRLHDLMNHDSPVDLYLVVSPAEIDRVKPLIRLMVDMIIRYVCREMEFKDGKSVKGYKHRMLLLFDEFTSIGKLPVIEKAIAYIAGYGGKMYLIVQDLGQLNDAYGKENSLMANCHIRIAYAPNKLETAQMLSEMTGKTTVVEKKTSFSYSKGGKSRSVNVQETARPLLTPDECMRLPGARKDSNGNVLEGGDMLILTAGRSPIYGRQILYFKDPTFSARSKMLAPEKSDSIYFERYTPTDFAKGVNFADFMNKKGTDHEAA